VTAIRRHLFAKVGHFSMENPGHVSVEINNHTGRRLPTVPRKQA